VSRNRQVGNACVRRCTRPEQVVCAAQRACTSAATFAAVMVVRLNKHTTVRFRFGPSATGTALHEAGTSEYSVTYVATERCNMLCNSAKWLPQCTRACCNAASREPQSSTREHHELSVTGCNEHEIGRPRARCLLVRHGGTTRRRAPCGAAALHASRADLLGRRGAARSTHIGYSEYSRWVLGVLTLGTRSTHVGYSEYSHWVLGVLTLGTRSTHVGYSDLLGRRGAARRAPAVAQRLRAVGVRRVVHARAAEALVGALCTHATDTMPNMQPPACIRQRATIGHPTACNNWASDSVQQLGNRQRATIGQPTACNNWATDSVQQLGNHSVQQLGNRPRATIGQPTACKPQWDQGRAALHAAHRTRG
jgi:hypothetical protein